MVGTLRVNTNGVIIEGFSIFKGSLGIIHVNCLTHCSWDIEALKRVIGKQSKPRSDAAEHGV